MSKQIFNETNDTYDTIDSQHHFKPKQEFSGDETQIEIDPIDSQALEGELLTDKFEQIVKPKPRWWKKVLGFTALLFLAATVAQSIQWVIDTWQQNQWIYFAFSLVGLSVVFVGITAIIKEWRRLVRLKSLAENQQKGNQIFLEANANAALDDSEKGKALCLDIARNMQLNSQHPALVQWQNHLNEAHTAQEVTYLFSEMVLQDRDRQAKKLVSKSAAESAVIVAISPLALVDMFFVAWRNIRMINKIAKIYGIELGYFSRLRLMRMILLNIAFAGATELVHEIGMDWLSQDITAKLSARAAQGIGVGLLTARLGIKTMEFCRPLSFKKDEKPRLSIVHRELLNTIKTTILTGSKIKEKDVL
ncbi:TIGR01620 family protein [Conservatibacter flavescens]|uniref:UPF0283 membrane protein CVP05_11080 n=1 Tax=Conservatibacter flavescens TaxID=28161 RepID=A0A2M8S0B7_9PAST|nr:TIGR01620 family protein [Conservatibacter flavescens]PJG84556.1 TIGR01620 family protein [Conservatibacter flavescens]